MFGLHCDGQCISLFVLSHFHSICTCVSVCTHMFVHVVFNSAFLKKKKKKIFLILVDVLSNWKNV